MRHDPDGVKLPRGVIYDPARQRYRVRLYRFHRVIWLSYARSVEEALTDFDNAKVEQKRIKEHTGHIHSVDDYVDALKNNLV